MRAPDPGRVFVVWTDPNTGRTRRHSEPIAEHAEAMVANARRFVFGAYFGAAREQALETVRVLREGYSR